MQWITTRLYVILMISGLIVTGRGQPSLTAVDLDSVEVVSLSPVPGMMLPASRLPANIQSRSDAQFESAQSLDLSDFLNRSLASVHVNQPGGNPLQPDLSYRGFQASPLLGLPQGLAVYFDGVRLNEFFGDIVNWDLLPEAAIASMDLIPGSNPLFGLNALGGALSIHSRSGFTYDEENISIFGGSFGRLNAEVISGGANEHFGYFFSGNYFRENGWRDFSRSGAGQLFAKGSWLSEKSKLDLGLNLGHSRLRGNGASPVELLEENRQAVFTHPDNMTNRQVLTTLRGSHYFNSALSFTATAYYRYRHSDTFNGDESSYEACEEEGNEGVLCLEGEEETEEVVIDQFGRPVAFSEAVATAANNLTNTIQKAYGATLQLNWSGDWMGNSHQFMAGMTFDGGMADFRSETELAQLNEDRGTTGSGLFDSRSFTGVAVAFRNMAAFAGEAFSPHERLTVHLSGRLNWTWIELRDQIGTALNGEHEFIRFNPGAGITYRLHKEIRVYGNFNIATRTPTPVELTCADPEDPCRLPNGFLADPPLEQVVAQTLEFGLRGRVLKNIDWNASAFQTAVRDDIYFVSAGPARNSGFFTNLGDTRRRGLELSLLRSGGRLKWQLHYTFLDASFQEDFRVSSPFHPLAEEGEIEVRAGDRLPLIPQQIFKAELDWELSEAFSAGIGLIYNGSQFLRGDEGNLADPIDGFILLNLRAQYQISPALSAFGHVNNLLDAGYETFGLFGEPDELEAFEAFEDPLFLTPGAPINGWIGIEFNF